MRPGQDPDVNALPGPARAADGECTARQVSRYDADELPGLDFDPFLRDSVRHAPVRGSGCRTGRATAGS